MATALDEERYGEAGRQLQELVADLRRIMYNLYPKDLEIEGFLTTIQKRLEDAKRHAQRHTPDFAVEFDCPPGLTDQEIIGHLQAPSHAVLLYRIVSEAIVNARKHAKGTLISLTLRQREDAIEISISDNGAAAESPFWESVGISLMRLRAEEIGASIGFHKSPAGGTTVVIRLPKRPGRMLPARREAVPGRRWYDVHQPENGHDQEL
ncbi:MAG: ATP-binding protein [Nitrospirota bacterium]